MTISKNRVYGRCRRCGRWYRVTKRTERIARHQIEQGEDQRGNDQQQRQGLEQPSHDVEQHARIYPSGQQLNPVHSFESRMEKDFSLRSK